MRWRTAFVSSLVAGLTAACGTLPDGRGWGEDATLEPDSDRIAWAATRAVQDPGTWIPAFGAVLVAITGADNRVSEWAREEQPVFGEDAGPTSDDLRDYADVAMFATALATPSGPPDEFLENKSRGVGVEALAVISTIGVTNILKYTVRREQPAGNGHQSFVSNHASQPFAYAALVRRNTDHLGLHGAAETAIDGGVYLMAAGSAWARVEMGLHYPSDQLAGAAIGNFIALFMHDAFLGLDPDQPRISAAVAPNPMVMFQLRW